MAWIAISIIIYQRGIAIELTVRRPTTRCFQVDTERWTKRKSRSSMDTGYRHTRIVPQKLCWRRRCRPMRTKIWSRNGGNTWRSRSTKNRRRKETNYLISSWRQSRGWNTCNLLRSSAPTFKPKLNVSGRKLWPLRTTKLKWQRSWRYKSQPRVRR